MCIAASLALHLFVSTSQADQPTPAAETFNILSLLYTCAERQRLFRADLTLDSVRLDLAYSVRGSFSPFKAGQRFLGCRETGLKWKHKSGYTLKMISFSGLFLFNPTPSFFIGPIKRGSEETVQSEFRGADGRGRESRWDCGVVVFSRVILRLI